MKHPAKALILAAFLALVSACAPTVQKDYSKFRAEDPQSILIVPVVNNAVDVDAPKYFLSTVTMPVAERGYYVFPVNLVRGVMHEEGLSDANMVHETDASVLGALFGADAVLYITINNWETQYIVISATTTVSFDYVLKSGRTGEELWRESATIHYSPQASGGGVAGLVAQAVAAAIHKAAPNYMPLARQANQQTIWFAGKGLPAGPYHDDYNNDHQAFASATGAKSGTAAGTKAARPASTPPASTPAVTGPTTAAPAVPSQAPQIAAAPVASVCGSGATVDYARDRGRIKATLEQYLNGSETMSSNFYEFKSVRPGKIECGRIELKTSYVMENTYRGELLDRERHAVLVKRDGQYSVDRIWE
ncbi:MAG: GNA1162 family protein [Pseudomonadota bacterium]